MISRVIIVSLYLAVFNISTLTVKAKVIKSEQEHFTIETIADDLVHPWALAFLPNGNMLVTERIGRLRLITNDNLTTKPISGLPKISVGGQGGLLDVAVHPDFKNNKLIYLSYAALGQKGRGTEISRAELHGHELKNLKTIFKAHPKTYSSLHFGSRLVFDDKNYLYITIGEKFEMRQAQNLKSHLGTIIRIKDDGTIPPDNPFVQKKHALQEIFSYGHRNPQGLTIHPVTRKIWAHEHGPRGGDEVNIIKSGANYGWPKITYGIDYSGAIISRETHRKGMEQPVVYWDPSIAPSGMTFYHGDKFPNWKGDLFVGALAHLHLRRIELDGEKVVGQEVILQNLSQRIRDVRSGPDGYLYILTDSSNGKVLRLKPTN